MDPRENPMLVDQEMGERALLESARSGRLAHAWLLTGPQGVGKATLARRLGQRGKPGQTANALHPGVIATNITRTIPSLAQLALRALAPLMLKTIPQGAATQCYLATSPAVAGPR